MKEDTQLRTGPPSDLVERRKEPRFTLEVEIGINSRSCGLMKGRTVDLSESGVSAMLSLELPVGELVELDFTLPFGQVKVYAIVRQRSAFRYGFQFAESNFLNDVIRPTCRVLAMQQHVNGGV